MLPPTTLFKNGTTMEAAGIQHSLFYAPGNPGAAAAPSPGINGAALTTYAGQIPFTNPGGGDITKLAQLELFAASAAGTLLIRDRLWHNSGITVTTTTAQAITSGAMPARDRNGSTNGEGLMACLEVSTATTNAGAVTTITLDYTNSAGTAGRTGTISSFPATAVAGTTVSFNLQAGDTGIRSIQGITLGTTLGAGAVHLVVYRELAGVGVAVANNPNNKDAIALGAPRCYDNTVPYPVWCAAGTAALTLHAQLTFAQG